MAVPTFKVLVNPSAVTPLVIQNLGITLQPLEERSIEIREYPDLVSEKVYDELVALIDSGDLQVKDHIGIIANAQEAKDYLLYPHFARSSRFEIPTLVGTKQFLQKTTQKSIEESFPAILKDNVLVHGTSQNIDFQGVLFDVSYHAETNRVIVTDNPVGIAGKLVDFAFGNVGNTNNKWLEFSSSSAASDEVPYIAPFDGLLIGLTYANKNDDSNLDVEIYLNGILYFTWEIRRKRWAYKTDIPTLPTIFQGDRISIFARKVTGPGSDPFTPVLEILFQVSVAVQAEGGAQNGV